MAGIFCSSAADNREYQTSSPAEPKAPEVEIIASAVVQPERRLSFKASRTSKARVVTNEYARGIVSNLAQEIEKYTPERLQQSATRGKYSLLASVAVVVFLVICTVLSQFLAIPEEIKRWLARASFIAVPFLAWFFLKRGIRSLKSKVLPFGMLESAEEYMERAGAAIDNGDFNSAEQLIEAALKKSTSKENKAFISAYATLGLVRAHMGKINAAVKPIAVAHRLAEHNYEARPSDTNAVVLARVLDIFAEFEALKDNPKECQTLYHRCVEILVMMKNPPAQTLIRGLTNYGIACSLNGRRADAIPALRKAKELATALKLPPAQQACAIVALSNILYSMNNHNESDELLKQAIHLIEGENVTKELGRIYKLMAEGLRARGDKYAAEEFYAKAAQAYSSWSPKNNPQHLVLLEEFSFYLHTISKDVEAMAVKKQAQEILRELQRVNFMNCSTEDGVAHRKVSQQVKLKPVRFPAFWTLFVLWQAFSVWEEGLRAAPHHRWYLLIVALVVLSLKLKHKFSPPSREELGEGALMALVAAVPFARSVLPELSALPKRQLIAVVSITAALIAGTNFFLLRPGEMPENLMPNEYLAIGQNMVRSEEFDKARIAFDKVKSIAANSDAARKAERCEKNLLPQSNTPAEAIKQNLKALALLNSGCRDAAVNEWTACKSTYPEFEAPYYHIALTYVLQHKLKEADEVLGQLLAKNPKYSRALLQMSIVKSEEKDGLASRKYLNDYLAALKEEEG